MTPEHDASGTEGCEASVMQDPPEGASDRKHNP